MYWRYSANSTLKPLNGLRWSPVRKPSTMVRAFSSSVPSRATTAGSRNGRSVGAQGMLHPALGNRHALEQAIDDRVGVDALGFGVKVRHDAVPEDRLGERLHVLHRYVIPTVHERPRLRAANDRLRSAEARAPLHPLVDVVEAALSPGPRRADESHGVSRD